MPDSGGTFSRLYSFTADAAANIAAQPGRFDNELNGMATALTNRMTRDGQAPPLADLPMGAFKFTGLAAGSLTGHSVNYDQLILKTDIASLSATTGAALIGVTGGGTVQAAITALNGTVTGTNFSDTSTTSLLIGTGAKTLTISTGKSYTIGQFVTIASTPSPANFMYGQITAYNSGTGVLTVNVTSIGGTGTFAAWSIALATTAALFTGGTLTSALITTASVVGACGLNVPHGTAPTSPVNGDIWTTTTAVFARINGVTKTLADTTQVVTFTGGTLTSALITTASAAGGAGFNMPHGTAPTSPVNGDTWTALTGLFARINGVTVQFPSSTSLAASYAPLTSPALVGTPTTLGFEIGFRNIPISARSAAFTFADADRGTGTYYTGAVAAATINPNSTTAIGLGAVIPGFNNGTGVLTLTRGAGVTLQIGGTVTSKDVAVAIGGRFTLIQWATNVWTVDGGGIS